MLIQVFKLDRISENIQNRPEQEKPYRKHILIQLGERDSSEVLARIVAQSGASAFSDPYDIKAIRQRPDAFMARNAMLWVLSDRRGNLNESLGALICEKRGEPTGYYASEEHIEVLIAKRKNSVASLAAMACEACPLQLTCGTGPTELENILMDKKVRRRFRDRVRASGATNSHFCATNLASKRLRKAVA